MYVKMLSWHVVSLTYRSGAVKTRCGLQARVVGTISGSGPVRETADSLPLGDKTCESCLRYTRHDQDESAGDIPADDSMPTDDEIAESDSPDVQGQP
jgi:hypothetical protein